VVIAGAGEQPAEVAGAVRRALGPRPGVSGTGVRVAAAVAAAIAGCRP